MQPQASLREPCPDLTPPVNGKADTLLRWITGTVVPQYRDCQARHKRLAEAVAVDEPAK